MISSKLLLTVVILYPSKFLSAITFFEAGQVKVERIVEIGLKALLSALLAEAVKPNLRPFPCEPGDKVTNCPAIRT
jgi:hypothetical protein